jgi:CheY-like chemotaxis protein
METLLIDDDSTSVFLTELLLKREQFADAPRSFNSAEPALDYLIEGLPERVPDIIFLDLNMPVMDGWEFLKALRPHEPVLAGRCHIYILTSSMAPSDIDRAREFSLVTRLIHKPLNGKVLHGIRAEIGEQKTS